MTENGIYSRIAPIYNLLDYPSELFLYKFMRQKWIEPLRNEIILEIGVGTGKNLKYYHSSNSVLGIDRAYGMLKQAKKKARNKSNVKLSYQNNIPWDLPRSDFTTVVATFVFCTMRDPKIVLDELLNWISSGTRLILFEYMNPMSTILKIITNIINPLTKNIFGVNFTRNPTEDYLDDNWKIIRKTHIIKNFIVVLEFIKK